MERNSTVLKIHSWNILILQTLYDHILKVLVSQSSTDGVATAALVLIYQVNNLEIFSLVFCGFDFVRLQKSLISSISFNLLMKMK